MESPQGKNMFSLRPRPLFRMQERGPGFPGLFYVRSCVKAWLRAWQDIVQVAFSLTSAIAEREPKLGIPRLTKPGNPEPESPTWETKRGDERQDIGEGTACGPWGSSVTRRWLTWASQSSPLGPLRVPEVPVETLMVPPTNGWSWPYQSQGVRDGHGRNLF